MNDEQQATMEGPPLATGLKPPPSKAMGLTRLRLTGLGGIALFVIAYLWGDPQMVRWSLPLGAVISMIGLLIRIWATGWLTKNELLVTRGPYSLTRNPLYLGTLLITFGHSLMSGVPVAPFLFTALWFAVYLPTMGEEQDYLAARYGAAFEAYRARVPILLPRLLGTARSELTPAAGEADGQEFSWPRVRRCYKGFIANTVVILAYVAIHAAQGRY